MNKLNNVLNTVLEDDNTANGGVSFKGETLRSFLDETGIDYNASMEEINNALVECGIKPIINEKRKENYTMNYLNTYLLDCETKQDEIVGWINGEFKEIEIVDVLGMIEEKGRIYAGVEVVTNGFPFGHIIHISFMNVWEHVYKDEMIEIQDVLSNLISEQLKTDLGLKDNILDDVKQWLKDNMEQYDNKEDLLREIVNYGVENVAPNHLIYNDDIMDFYDEHYIEIDEILERDNKKNIGTIEAVWYAWEKVAHEYLTYLESK